MRRRAPANTVALAPCTTMGYDGTALGLLQHSSSSIDEASVEKAAPDVEEIDTEEDDAEFDDRAHWGRRRARAAGPKRKNPREEDKSQPKISLFYSAQEPATAASRENTAASCTPNDVAPADPTPNEVHRDASVHDNEMEVPARDSLQSECAAAVNSPQVESLTPPPSSTELTPAGRPKRQAVVRAEQAALRGGNASKSLFMTPPAVDLTSNDSVDVVKEGPSRKPSSGPPSGRKRKLELAGDKKKPTATANSATKALPPSAFFLSEREKQELSAIEAVESFKEQLRQQRERDLAFYGEREAKNPFFQAKSGSSAQKAIEIDGAESCIIDLSATPDPSPAKPPKSRWCKELPTFPHIQHAVAPLEDTAVLAVDSLKIPSRKPMEDVVVIDCEDEAMDDPVDTVLDPEPDAEVCTEAALDDAFWMLSAGSMDAVPQSREEAIEWVSEAYAIKEKRVRRTLAALEAARAKRFDKAANLSLVDLYTPVAMHGLVGNKAPLKKLSAWLGAWKSDSRDRRYDSELFAFQGDDSEDEDDELLKLFVLEGEVGSGKSAAVYACAEELGYEVIEINAGQLRSGKAVVDIAGEATQSTRVLHAGGEASSAKKTKKQRKKARRDRPSHLSLVLFEDVDLVFDDDKGFLSTLGSIAKHSKCPIAVTCRRLPDGFPSTPPAITEALVRPPPSEFMAWLALVAFLEELPVSQELAARLAHLFACDVRRALHFLQTYRAQISASSSSSPSSRGGRSLAWSTPTSDALAPAWTRSSLRPFDLLASNFLPLLRGSLCDAADASTKSVDELRREYAGLCGVLDVVDAVSAGDEWETACLRADDRDDVFAMERTRRRAMELRRLSLQGLSTQAADSAVFLSTSSVSDGVVRALQASRRAHDRSVKPSRLAAVKAKLELPLLSKGSAVVGARFSSDYVPMVARILECSEPLQESRRRASRRNHYLREVLSDMSVVDDIGEFHAYAVEPREDEIVPASASPSTEAGAMVTTV